MRAHGNLIVVLTLLLTANVKAESLRLDGEPTNPSTPSKNTSEFRLYRQQLAAAHALARAGHHSSADRALAAVIAHPMFATLADVEQRGTLSAAAWAAVRIDQLDRARSLYLRATEIDSGDPDDWYRLSLLEYDLGQFDASATALTRLAEGWPELLVNADVDHIYRLLHKTDPVSKARLELLQSLFDANWNSKTDNDSGIWYELALLRIERGEVDAARAAIKRVNAPMQLVRLRSDKRFDTIVSADSWTFNVELAARRRVENLQQRFSLDPHKLDTQVQLSYAMLTAGMHQEIIELADGAVAAIANASIDASPFADIENQVWLMNNRAIALRRLGRVDEALVELVRASQLTEAGQINVSQALNLGQFYCSLGRPDDALAAIATVGEMSGYGRMVQASVEQCAALQKGDQERATRALDYIRTHRKDSQIQLLGALLEAGHLDDAAITLIEVLSSPFDRAEVLEWLQDYRRPESLPGDVQARARREALLARADVQGAVARFGRIDQYDIYGDHSME